MKSMIIIGAGAAGMMTAIKASDHYKVTVLEKSDRTGRKLFITGKGRCNITNDSDEETFLKNVVNNNKFLFSAINNYNQQNLIQDFQQWGMPVKTERGNRAFPVSDKSADVIHTLEYQMKKRGVKLVLNTLVKDLILEDYMPEDPKSKAEKKVTGVILQNGQKMMADVVVVCAGGLAYPSTGATGIMMDAIEDKGIAVTKCRPSLVPLNIKESYCKDMMGLSLKNVTLTVTANKDEESKLKKAKEIYKEQGEMLFTHFGISGPLVLSASSYITSFLRKYPDFPKAKIRLSLDLKPALSVEQLSDRIARDWESMKNKEFQNSLGLLLPRLMIPVVVDLSGIKPEKQVNAITHEEREKLVSVLKNFPLSFNGQREYNEAIITSGGISVKEIDPRSMEIKKIAGLRVAGEIIDVDALTGGFNLQIAWSTAVLAAQ